MNTVELIKVINNIPVKGEVCAKDLLPEKKPLGIVRPGNRDWACKKERCHTLSNKTSLQ